MNQYPTKLPAVRLEARRIPGDEIVVTVLPAPDTGAGRWTVQHRDGRVVSVATLVEAVMTLTRWVAGTTVVPDPGVVTLPGGYVPAAVELANACRVLGAIGPASGADLLDCSPVILTDAQRSAVLAELGAS